MGKRIKLTYKQKKFVKEYINTNGNGTKAVLNVYDTKDKRTAAMIASKNLTKDNVQEELKQLLQREEYKVENFTSRLSAIAQDNPFKGYTGADILRANELMLKLHGVLTDRRQVTTVSFNADLNKLSKYELLELRNKKQKETDEILEGEVT
jgi:hypothetical protein